MRTITVTNRKGGVGKTTLATHIAAAASLLGWRVCLIDTDSQGHCASAFGLPKAGSLYALLADEAAQLADNVIQVPPQTYTPAGWEPGELYLVRSDKSTAHISSHVSDPDSLTFLTRHVLRDALDLDLVVIDTAPSNTMFDGSVMRATDGFVYVVEPAALSFDGLTEAARELKTINKTRVALGNPAIKALGVQPNKMRANTSNHRDNVATLATDFIDAPIWSPIPQRTIIESALEYGMMVYAFAPDGAEARLLWQMSERALKASGIMDQSDNRITELYEVAYA